MPNITLNQVLAVMTVVLPLLIPAGQYLYKYLLEQLPSNQRGVVDQVVSTVVKSVEQQAAAGAISPDQRKAQAVTAITTIAKQFGVGQYASPEVVDALIEAVVLEMNQARQTPAQDPQPVGFYPDVVGSVAPSN